MPVYQTDQFKDPPEGVLVNNRFILRQRVGKGSFGCVFKGKRIRIILLSAKDKTTNQDIALKMVRVYSSK